MIILLSHLGIEQDREMADQFPDIDLIVGGHSHTFMEEPTRVRHGERETLVFQVGWGGINLGRIDFYLRRGAVAQAEAFVLPVGPRAA